MSVWMPPLLTTIIRLVVLVGLVYLAHVALVLGRGVPRRQWTSVIVMGVLTYPWGWGTGWVIRHFVTTAWINSRPFGLSGGMIVAWLSPVAALWGNIPLIAALILGFILITKPSDGFHPSVTR